MSDSSSETKIGLHLPNLSISAFRGIQSLELPRLGRVTLLVGRNGVGKTTILEAIRVYAARGQHTVLADLLQDRGELSLAIDEEGDNTRSPDWSTLFYGRGFRGQNLSISPTDTSKRLQIETTSLTSSDVKRKWDYLLSSLVGEDPKLLRVTFGTYSFHIPWNYSARYLRRNRLIRYRYRNQLPLFPGDEMPAAIECVDLGPGLASSAAMADWWDRIALTKDEDRSLDALRIVFGQEIQRVAVIGRGRMRDVVIKIDGRPNPIPLRSLGDGAIRFFATGLALANGRNGFLTIDEAENGIHHTIQRDYWHMILTTAKRNNVQVIATTHGWDCVRTFAQACNALDNPDGVLIRVEKSNGVLRAIEYPKHDMVVAAEQGIEVR